MKLETKYIELSSHAYERMQERFPDVSKNKSAATNHARSLLKSAEYIGIVPDKDGIDSHMFVFNKQVVFHINTERNLVITLYENNHTVAHKELSFRQSVISIYRKEFRKTHRLEMAKRRRLNHMALEVDVEIAKLKYRKAKTRSQNVKENCDKMILKLQNEIWSLRRDIEYIQADKRRIAYALAADTY